MGWLIVGGLVGLLGFCAVCAAVGGGRAEQASTEAADPGPVPCATCAGEPWCAQVEAVSGWWEQSGRYQEQVCPQWRAVQETTGGEGA
jgi:hypothetical protein